MGRRGLRSCFREKKRSPYVLPSIPRSFQAYIIFWWLVQLRVCLLNILLIQPFAHSYSHLSACTCTCSMKNLAIAKGAKGHAVTTSVKVYSFRDPSHLKWKGTRGSWSLGYLELLKPSIVCSLQIFQPPRQILIATWYIIVRRRELWLLMKMRCPKTWSQAGIDLWTIERWKSMQRFLASLGLDEMIGHLKRPGLEKPRHYPGFPAPPRLPLQCDQVNLLLVKLLHRASLPSQNARQLNRSYGESLAIWSDI